MPLSAPIDEARFQRMLKRHLALPLAVGALSAAIFVGVIAYLLLQLGWVEHTQRVIGKAHELMTLTVDLETGARGFLLTGEERFLEPYVVGRPKVGAGMAALVEMVEDNPAQIERLQRVRSLQAQWESYSQELIDRRRRELDAPTVQRAEAGKQLFDGIRAEFRSFLDSEETLLQERNGTARRTAVMVVVGFVGLLLALSIVMAVSARRQVLSLSGTYGAALRKHEASAQTLEHQAWLRTSESELTALLAGTLALPEIGRRLLEFLATKTGATLGVLHAMDSTGRLSSVAAHGVALAAAAGPSTSSNPELVDQVVRDGLLRQLEGIDSRYFRVTTSLGETRPAAVALAPVSRDGQVNGVIELGFLSPMPATAAALLGVLAGTVGNAIAAALYRGRLQQSLEETQQLNEELEVQQEELRSTNEALQHQSQQLQRSQAELERQQADLEMSNQRLAEQAVTLDRRNEALTAAQAELHQRAEELQRASRYKSEFLANMSHELRTPLNSILILARLLGENRAGNLTAEQVKFSDTVYAAGNDLLSLINDILDLSKVEAGKLNLSLQDVDTADLVQGLRDVFMPQAAAKGLRFDVALAGDAPAQLHTDRQRLDQVLKNMLSNAVKFTETGGVALRIAPAGEGLVSFEVEDSGIGIDEAHQAHVFDAFHQGDGSIARKFGGTGLGLAISRDLAELLGGHLALRSVPGHGSVFTLTVPVRSTGPAAAEAHPAPPAPAAAPVVPPVVPPVVRPLAPPMQGRPAAAPLPAAEAQPAFPDDREDADTARAVLVIEDDPTFARVLYELAHEMGYRCLVAHSAAAGLALATAHRPQAILLDIRLPDASGLMVLQQLKEQPHTRHIPVHVVAGEDLSQVALPMGAVGYAVKPATTDELRTVFQRLGERLAHTLKRVLVVEDDERQRDSVVRLISGEGVQIDAAACGEDALALLREHAYDCVVIDLVLPDMSGQALLDRMTHQGIAPLPPVIVYTGRVLTREEEEALSPYSRSIIIKGARSPERLLDEVTLFLHQVESQLRPEQQTLLQAARSRDQALEGRRLLLVDDDVRNIFALSGALEQRGLSVVIARNGEEALRKLDTEAGIDLVLMDVMMPVMDGLEATRRLRTDPRWRKLPVIALTAKAMRDDQEQCQQAGMNDYLAKPVDLDRLFALLRVWMPGLKRA